MGFLYPWSRIRENRIPEPQELERFGQELVEALRQHTHVCAASIYGSVARGDHNARSDIDLAVVCEDDAIFRVRRFVGELRREACDCNIILNTQVMTRTNCLSGQVHYGPSFVQTFRELAGSPLSFGNVHELLHPTTQSVQHEMCQRLGRNLRFVLRDHHEFMALLYDDLSSFDAWLEWTSCANRPPLHLYMRFARRMLYWKHSTLKDDSKHGVVSAFFQEDAFYPLFQDFLKLQEIDLSYDRLLGQARARVLSRNEYLDSVRELVQEGFVINTKMLITALTLIGVRQNQFVSRRNQALARATTRLVSA